MRHHLLITLLSFATLGVACAMQSSHPAADKLRSQLADDWKYWMIQYPERHAGLSGPERAVDGLFASGCRRARPVSEEKRRAVVDRRRHSAWRRTRSISTEDLVETAAKGLDFHNDAYRFAA
jgi:hypothetical protein